MTQPQWAVGKDGTKFVTCRLFPLTLNELRKYCREFGRPAARDAEWSAVTTWLMHSPEDDELSNPSQIASVAVGMVRDFDRIRFGWPRHDGKEWPPAALDYLSPDVRQEAERLAAETLADWRKAGRPHLGPDRFKATYQYLISCPAFRKHVRPLADNNIKEHE